MEDPLRWCHHRRAISIAQAVGDVPAATHVDDLDIAAATSVYEYLWRTNYEEGRKDKAKSDFHG
jgi:hypothetical protein